MSHLDRKRPESVTGRTPGSDTCHGNAAELRQVYLPMSLMERKSTESVAGGPFGSDTWHRNATEPWQVYLGESY